MASTENASRQYYQQQQQQQQQHQHQYQQQQQRYGPSSSNSSSGGNNGSQGHYYPDQPQPSSRSRQQQQQRSYDDLTPQSSFSSTSSSSHYNNNNNNNSSASSRSPTPIVSRGDSGGKPKVSQLSYLRTPANNGSSSAGTSGAPPSPISPSTPISPGTPTIEALTSHMNLTRLDEPIQDRVTLQSVQQQQQQQPGYDQSRYQQPRKKSVSAGQHHQQYPQQQPQPPYPQQQQQQRHHAMQQDSDGYGAGSNHVPKQSTSSGSARSIGSQGGGGGRTGELKQSSSSTSAHSLNSVHSRGEYQGGSPLRQSPSGGSAYSQQGQGQGHGQHRHMNGELKQSGSSGSAASVSSSRSQQQLHPSHSNGSNSSTSSAKRHQQQQQQQQQNHQSPSPPSPLSYLPIDHEDDLPHNSNGKDHERDQEKHRQQALQYQQQLQQKPPSAHGDDNDSGDDSDSGSLLSYRRSISRLSMSYKRTGTGAPNISLFAPGQRPAMLSHGAGSGSGYSTGLTGSQKMIQEQREERLRQQKHQQQDGYGAGSSMASVDQHSRQEEGRPIMHRQNPGGKHYQGTGAAAAGGPPTGIQIPERSTSADSHTGGSGSRSRQQGYPGGSSGSGSGGRSNPSSPSMANRQINGNSAQQQQLHHHHQNQHSQQPPRPSHESGHSQRSRPDRLNLPPNDYQQEHNLTMGPRSRSPGPMNALPARGPGSPLPGSRSEAGSRAEGVYRQNGYPGGFNNAPSTSPALAPPPSSSSSSRGGGASSPGPNSSSSSSSNNNNSNGLNMHPAHHLASGGYVRPEEPVGPSNPMPEKAEDFVRQGIEFHEVGDIAKATHFFRTAAELGDPVGMLMYGLSVRHGWGCASNRQLAFQYLQKSAEHAVGDLKSRDSFASTAAKGELVLAIYELGICFRHGWGAEKNKKTAAYYFEIAANLGDPDAQNDLAWCYYHGVGVKKDMYKAAKYYRLAAAQGLETVGNSWIWKDKYGGIPPSPTTEKAAHTAF